MTVVEIALDEGITGLDAEAVRQSVAELPAYIHQPVSRARLTIRRIGSARVKCGYVADANVIFNGRVIAAHAAGMTALEAADAARDRLRRQVGRVAGKGRRRRNEKRPDEALAVDLDASARGRRDASLAAADRAPADVSQRAARHARRRRRPVEHGPGVHALRARAHARGRDRLPPGRRPVRAPLPRAQPARRRGRPRRAQAEPLPGAYSS